MMTSSNIKNFLNSSDECLYLFQNVVIKGKGHIQGLVHDLVREIVVDLAVEIGLVKESQLQYKNRNLGGVRKLCLKIKN